MIPFEAFRESLAGSTRLELERMLYDLSASWERVLCGGGSATQRAKTARAVQNERNE